MIETALNYVALGWSVIPLRPREKRPAISWEAYQHRIATEEEIRDWWTRWPDANIGIVTGGVSGLIALDLDSAEAVQKAEELGLPQTPRCRTGKGEHVYFKHPGGEETKNFCRKMVGMDLRADGGYVVAPPSVHPTGALYDWVVSPWEGELEAPPVWLLELIKPSRLEENVARLEGMASQTRKERALTDDQRLRRYAEAALQREAESAASAIEGSRNTQHNKAAFSMAQFIAAGVLTESEVVRELTRAASYAGLSQGEIEATIKSGLEAGGQHPRDLPEATEGIQSITSDELEAYCLPDGPKFQCNLPSEHFLPRFIAYGSEVSDAYPEFWFAGGIFALAVVADKKLRVDLRQGSVYPNLYVAITGKSSLSRKSTVVGKTESLLCRVVKGLLPSLVPTEFSPEAFTEHLSDYNHAPWIRDEAAGVLALMKREYMRGFKDSLMQLYDCRPFYRKLRSAQRKNTKNEFRVDDPYLNLLFATTDASLGANTEQNDTLSGFLARFVFFFPRGKKNSWLPLEEGTGSNSVFEDIVRSQLTGIVTKVDMIKECTALHFSPEASAYFTEWQRVRESEWTDSNDGAAMQIYSRLATVVVKLGMLFELGSPDFDPTNSIRLEFVQEACRLVDSYLLPTARSVYELVGANVVKNRLDRITTYLKSHNGKAQKRDLLRATRLTKKEFDEALETMLESGEVTERIDDPHGKRGRPKIWILLQDINVNSVINVINVNSVIKVNRDKSGDEDGRDINDKNDKNDKNDENDINDGNGTPPNHVSGQPVNGVPSDPPGRSSDSTPPTHLEGQTEGEGEQSKKCDEHKENAFMDEGSEQPGKHLEFSKRRENVALAMGCRELHRFTALTLAGKSQRSPADCLRFLQQAQALGLALLDRDKTGDWWTWTEPVAVAPPDTKPVEEVSS
jgi:hypothetical protein